MSQELHRKPVVFQTCCHHDGSLDWSPATLYTARTSQHVWVVLEVLATALEHSLSKVALD